MLMDLQKYAQKPEPDLIETTDGDIETDETPSLETDVATETLTNEYPTPPLSAQQGQQPVNPLPVSKFGAFPVTLPTNESSSSLFIIPTTEQKGYDVYWMNKIVDDPYLIHLLHILETATPDMTITFYMSGPGGAADVAARMASAIDTTQATVHTVATGDCASTAAMIWSFGHTRYVEPGACVMFHMSSHGDMGNSDNVYHSAVIIQNYIRSMLFDSRIRGVVLTDEEVTQLVEDRRDIYLDAETLVARGITLLSPTSDRKGSSDDEV